MLGAEPQTQPQPLDGPLGPDKAPASMQLEPGLRLELVAAEPLVIAPVAIAFDERGRAFVAENRGYPTGPGPNEPPVGRVALLEDTDADGRFDKRTEFAEGLSYPNGLLPWDGGLIVTCAPDIFWMKDVDGDGRADDKKVLLTGFSTGGSTQLRVSHPSLGLDGWIYVTSGLTGGKIVHPDYPARPAIETRRTDLRFKPGTDQFEAADGGAQFGLTFDDFGHRFICYNRVQVQHVVAPSRYWRRNSHLAFSETVENCPADMAPEPTRGHGAAARLYPLSSNVTTADSHAGTFTAACAVTVWRGSSLPERYKGGAFSCDPTGNLVHFDSLEQRGATFAAKRIGEKTEFLRSSDNWFRPVFIANGPEGALYVCDMYRKTIEHPDYLPVEVRKHTDFTSGKNMGRIWRVVRDDLPRAQLAAARKVDLSTATTVQLVAALKNENGWRRDTAFRLLLARRDAAAIPALAELLVASDVPAATPVAALRLLEAQGAVTDDVLQRSLAHRVAGVREQALVLVEPKLSGGDAPQWAARVLPLINDDDSRVRFQATLCVGAASDAGKIGALAKVALRDAQDRWLRAAVFSAIEGRERDLLATLLATRPTSATSGANANSSAAASDAAGLSELFGELGRLLGASEKPETAPQLVKLIVVDHPDTPFHLQAAVLAGIADSLRNRGTGRDTGSVWAAVLPASDAATAPIRDSLTALLKQAAAVAADSKASETSRRLALSLLAHSDFATVGDGLLKLVELDQPSIVQTGAIRALGLMRDARIAQTLLSSAKFPKYTPKLREEVLSALLSAPHHLPGLLDAIEAGVVPPGAIDTLRRRQLTEHRDPEMKARAAKLFDAARSGDRGKVYDELKSVVTLPSDSENGRQVFKRVCAACHRLEREGTPVGPDLFSIRNQPKEAILLHIVIPEHEITQGYAAYVVTTKDGRV
ncbi:MAG TPA: c-type cytochrome, partial [Pirellulaceae bacterium]|nr:c-type cytochrome [Pirellulaceae bacterium]